MMEYSKNVYNSAIYCQRRLYDVWQVICRYHVEHFENYKKLLTNRDVEILMNYCVRHSNWNTAKELYAMYGGNKTQKLALLSRISDMSIQDEFKNHASTIKSKNGKSQTTSMYIETLNKVEASDTYQNIKEQSLSSESYKSMEEFVPKMKEVLLKMSQNREKTLEQIATQKQMEESGLPFLEASKKGRYRRKKEKTETESDVINVIPPSYIGTSFMDLYVKQNIPSYKLLNSQTAQQTICRVDDAYKSFFGSVANGLDASPPKYNRTLKYNLIWQNNSFKILNNKVRVSVSQEMKKGLKQKYSGGTDDERNGYLYFKLPEKFSFNKTICEVELVPSTHVGSDSFKLVVKYSKNIPPQADTNNLNKASIDLGVSNVATMFSPCLKTPIVFSGRGLVGLNKKYNELIDSLKSEVKRRWNKDTCKQIQQLFVNRSNNINNALHCISNAIIQCCKNNKIHELIIGYNTNWKTNINIGKNNNRKFYAIPYSKLLHMLFYKGEENGIKVVENEEAYTSKCDALGLEDVKKHDTYMGRRIKRGLFQSSRDVLINADVNGAINIMRKYCLKVSSSLIQMLEEHIQNLPFSRVCNPITVFHKLNLASMTCVQMAIKGLMTAPSCS